jgi:hypothetical protein
MARYRGKKQGSGATGRSGAQSDGGDDDIHTHSVSGSSTQIHTDGAAPLEAACPSGTTTPDPSWGAGARKVLQSLNSRGTNA